MSWYGVGSFSMHQSQSPPLIKDDILIKKILLTHDPDGRHLDSQRLLRAVEKIMLYASTPDVSVSALDVDTIVRNYPTNIEILGTQETLGQTIYKISNEILHKHTGDTDIHARVMVLFELLGNYRWDAKVLLVLAAFATSYGEFWLILQIYPANQLAASVAVLKQLPRDLKTLKPRFKALRLLVKAMVDMTKCLIKFEYLPLQHITLDNELLGFTKPIIYTATYWIIRSAVICASTITENLSSTAITAWELSSLAYKISSIGSSLRVQVDFCRQQTELKLHQKLLSLFNETYVDNQEVLQMLVALRDGLTLKDGLSSQLGISDLKNKVVMVVVSKPDILPLERLFFLVQRTGDLPSNKEERKYQILWIPVSTSETWNDADERSFEYLSNSLPWYSILQPWSLNSEIVNYIKQEWNFKDEPIMVVLDPQGKITNLNAMDMVLTWGAARAYPLSTSREKQLWEEEKWTIRFMVDEIDHLLTMQIEQGRNLCIYGSNDLEWVRDFHTKMKRILEEGVPLEVFYVGHKNPNEHVKHILNIIDRENLGGSLSLTKIDFFWLRLESMRRSSSKSNLILQEVSSLLDLDDNKKVWAAIGKGSSTDLVKLQGTEVMECLDMFSKWVNNVGKLGLAGAIRTAIEPRFAGPCSHTNVVTYNEGSSEETSICTQCKSLMEKVVLYKCEGGETE
ncbi:Sieve element occlusion, N-terminal [Dillenia turbinata]|uniref:Sieve element occlusion, N-terminal n=1 Tax=Dillenia turbinata TaxID=194707 RepID=A0AAN8V299_9MAGN